MSPLLWVCTLLLAGAVSSDTPAADRSLDKVVRVGRGPGEFRRIQDALDAAGDDTAHTLILIGKGLYSEKLFITRSNISLVGEDRDSTRIVFAELRSNWTQSRDNRQDGTGEEADWGAGVINIGDGVTDVTIANLTVHNNYGALYGSRAHQFTIRAFKPTRIALLHCTVISDGGDAVSLWNREGGMYYHASCSFEGWVDYVCPRGWCYIVDSEFYGHNLSASIWHDGSAHKEQKFVIRRSSFDGVPGFPLGRHHRDAQFYLLDCTFSEAMADTPIYAPKSPNTVPWAWGERHYYWNCHRDGGDYDWFRDNLNEAEGSPDHAQVTALWTFGGEWDPENTLPSVLPFAAIPSPGNGSCGIPRSGTTLGWIPGRGAKAQILNFGTTSPPPRAQEHAASRYSPGELDRATAYFWRVDTVVGSDTLRGQEWTFTTQ